MNYLVRTQHPLVYANELNSLGGFWEDILESVKKIPIVGSVLKLFEKDKLTQDQAAILSRLPEPYLSMAIAEIDSMSAADARENFEQIFSKYLAMYQAEQDRVRKQKEAGSSKLITYGIIGAVALGAIISIALILKKKRG